jgi:hypothetical protein
VPLPLRDAAAVAAAALLLALGGEGDSMASRILSSGWSSRGGSCELIHSCVALMPSHMMRAFPSTISSTSDGRMWSSAYTVSGTCVGSKQHQHSHRLSVKTALAVNSTGE